MVDPWCGRSRGDHGRCRRHRDHQPLAVEPFSALPFPRAFVLALALLALASPRLRAQGAERPSNVSDVDAADHARFRFGVLRFTPSIVVSGIGVDNNVFNDAVDPKRDTTAAVGPALNFWLKLGKARLSASTNGQYLYFKEYTNQRAWNTANTAQLDLPLSRIKPFIGGTYTNSRERPGFEIDARARRRDASVKLGTDLRFSGKSTLVVTGSQANFKYDRDETFLGATLADELDHQTMTEQLQLRYAMTPLTMFVLTADGIQDRFDFTGDRNADSIRVMPGFEMKPFALISGKVAVGFRHFNTLNEQLPNFDGLVASADLNYSVAATRVSTHWKRDVEYSFEPTQPFYALNDVGVSITQRLSTTWDVVVRGGWQTLDYRQLVSSTDLSRSDHGAHYGAGIGCRLGEVIRLGIDANYYRRDSEASGVRNYEGLRMGASVSYGLAQ